MILVNLKGRIGNAMFLIALGKYLSDKVGTELYIKKDPYWAFGNYYDTNIFPYEFFRNLNILDENYDVSSLTSITKAGKDFEKFSDFPIMDNLYLDDYFLSPSYVNYDTIKDLYVPSKELKDEIFDLYHPTRNSLMINVRRGDFLHPMFIREGYHCEPKKYWEAVYKYMGKEYDKVFVTSDDIKWCKDNFDFCDNIVFVDKQTENPKIFVDLFIPTFVGDNAISCSTFSWWGAYLNDNPDKKVVVPFPWNVGPWIYGSKNINYYNNAIKFDIHTFEETKKVAVCCIAKNENLYIREWVNHYRSLGVAKIFIYDNNELDGERFEDVIGDYIDSGYVEVIDVRGTPYAEVYDGDINLQNKCYYDCYENLVNDFDWVCFFDVDEFLSLRKPLDLFSFLNQDCFKDCGTILVGQEAYGDNGLVRYDDRPVQERFVTPSKSGGRFVKSIVRTNKIIASKYIYHMHHIFRLKDEKVRFANGAEFKDPNYVNWVLVTDKMIEEYPCMLKHYRTKTIEEFFKRNLGRTWGKIPFDEKLTFEKCKKHFFEYNDVTPEKLEYLKSIWKKS